MLSAGDYTNEIKYIPVLRVLPDLIYRLVQQSFVVACFYAWLPLQSPSLGHSILKEELFFSAVKISFSVLRLLKQLSFQQLCSAKVSPEIQDMLRAITLLGNNQFI